MNITARKNAAVWINVLLMLAVAFVLRGRYFGSPNIHVDEQFYLLVGDRMLNHGAIPYVDIWDRKPVGLFLVYAAIRLLGGEGIIQYQIVATIFAAGTAVLVSQWASRFGDRISGAIGGIFYLIYIHRSMGYGGQAEIFLNLFVTGAALLLADRLLPSHHPHKSRQLLGIGALIMLLCGLAIQIKPTAVFPGFFLGITLIYLSFRSRLSLGWIAVASLLWVAVALLPTVLVAAWYAAHHHLDAFLFANVYSLGVRSVDSAAITSERLIGQVLKIALPLGGALVVLLRMWWQNRGEAEWNRQLYFVLGWQVAGLVAYLCIGAYFPHYALIAIPMLSVLIGVAARPKGWGWFIIGGVIALSTFVLKDDEKRVREQQASAPEVYKLAEKIKQNLHGDCLYVHRGAPIFYYLTQACIPTRYAFTYHLSLERERAALGVSSVDEVNRILASRPAVIVFDEARGEDARWNKDNKDTAALVRKAVAAHYHVIGTAGPTDAPSFTAYGLTN